MSSTRRNVKNHGTSDGRSNAQPAAITFSDGDAESEWTQPSPDILPDADVIEYVENLVPGTRLEHIKTWRADGHIYCSSVDGDWFEWVVETAVAEYDDPRQARSFAGDMCHEMRAYQSKPRLYDEIEARFDAQDDTDETVNADSQSSNDGELATDGGREEHHSNGDRLQLRDRVRWCGELWAVIDISDSGDWATLAPLTDSAHKKCTASLRNSAGPVDGAPIRVIDPVNGGEL